MALRRRLLALVVAAVALALTVTGVVIAATDSNPSGATKDPLALNGYPPKTANLLVTLSSSGGVGLSANVAVDFRNDRVDAVVRFPLVVVTAAVELRLARGNLYARSADVSSGPWLSTPLKTPSLFGVSLELTKPDINLITGFNESATTSGYSTTYTFTHDHVALSSLFGPNTTSTLGSVRWTITVGSQGEASKSTLTVTSKHSTSTLSVTVLSYNGPVDVAVPTLVHREAASSGFVQQLLGAADFARILVPRELTSLAQTSIS